MPSTWRLDLHNGDFLIATPPPMHKDGKIFHRIVQAYLLEFKKAIAGRNVWPPEQSDPVLYAEFGLYYQKIGDLLNIDPTLLTIKSRHGFFVATEPVEFRGDLVPGLSGLEQLMGYSYREEAVPEPKYTTGDAELDIATDALLVFKKNALKLMEMFGLDEVARMITQANHRLSPNEEGDVPKRETWKDTPEFEAKRGAIALKLKEWGVYVPPQF